MLRGNDYWTLSDTNDICTTTIGDQPYLCYLYVETEKIKKERKISRIVLKK